ncbi:MAG: hypothetical protein KDK23_05175 [Leptospiraceae bacterium]|nr:hypothetical protein [Leptospiraceae bacterium]
MGIARSAATVIAVRNLLAPEPADQTFPVSGFFGMLEATEELEVVMGENPSR